MMVIDELHEVDFESTLQTGVGMCVQAVIAHIVSALAWIEDCVSAA